jgi:hypothetical protein
VSPEEAGKLLGVSTGATADEIKLAIRLKKRQLLDEHGQPKDDVQLIRFERIWDEFGEAFRALVPDPLRPPEQIPTNKERAERNQFRSLIIEKLVEAIPGLSYDESSDGQLFIPSSSSDVGGIRVHFDDPPELLVFLDEIMGAEFGQPGGPEDDQLSDEAVADLTANWICAILADKVVFWIWPGAAAEGSFWRDNADDPLAGLPSQFKAYTWSGFLGYGKGHPARSEGEVITQIIELNGGQGFLRMHKLPQPP